MIREFFSGMIEGSVVYINESIKEDRFALTDLLIDGSNCIDSLIRGKKKEHTFCQSD
jgi:hypothetical protein